MSFRQKECTASQIALLLVSCREEADAIKGFALDENGDVLIENNEIAIVVGEALTQQKVSTVLRTNLKEWFFDWAQGINFDNLLGKGINEELVRYEIEQGLKQVDDTFTITDFSFEVDHSTRKAKVTFSAQTESGEEAGGEYTWA